MPRGERIGGTSMEAARWFESRFADEDPVFKRLSRWLLFATLAALCGFGWYRIKSKSKVAPTRTAKIEKLDLVAKVTATGTLSARVTVQVGSQVSGCIQELRADFNSLVTKGQIIAKLDTRALEAARLKARAGLVQANGRLAKATATVAQAKREYERAKKLRAAGLASQSDLDLAQSALESAQADLAVANGNVASAAAMVSDAEVNLSFGTIHSPIDGIVLSRNVDVGQTVAASLQAPVLFTIAQDLHQIQVDTFVSEADVGKVKPGMPATFTVDAYAGKRFSGKVREVRHAAQILQSVVTYDAVLDVENPDLELKPGMTANVTFVWGEAKRAVAVPNAALRFRAPTEMLQASEGVVGAGIWTLGDLGGGASPGASKRAPSDESTNKKRSVWVLRNGRPVQIRIETGLSDGSYTQETSGELRPGDDVVVEYVSEGAPPSTGTVRPLSGGSGKGMKF